MLPEPFPPRVYSAPQRAGLDISEHYTKVMKMDLMGDGKIWINVGSDDVAKSIFDQSDISSTVPMTMDVSYRALDTDAVPVEIYLVERPFFNVPYLFITVRLPRPRRHPPPPSSLPLLSPAHRSWWASRQWNTSAPMGHTMTASSRGASLLGSRRR